MKNLCTLLFCLIINLLHATGYYVSADGDNTNEGTSPSEAWQTLARVSSEPLNAGDTVYLRRGDTFRGFIDVNQSYIVFTAYGTGAKPIISGAEPITGWTENGDHWEASVTQTVRNFFVNNEEMTLARYPDNSFLYLNSATLGGLTDSDLSAWASGYWNGSRICVRTSQWSWEKTTVNPLNGHSGTQITYQTPLTLAAPNGYGYFFYDKFEELNAATEYYVDSVANLIYYVPPSGQDPNDQTCEISTYTAGIRLNGSVSHVDIYNIVFEKQGNAGVLFVTDAPRSCKIDNCEFYRQYNYGISAQGRWHEISNCTFRSVDGLGVYVSGLDGGIEIHHNTFRNIGRYRNSGVGGQINLSAVKIAFGDSCHLHHNDIDSTGYCGISADGAYHLVEKNVAKHCMSLLNDGAPFKTFGPSSHHVIFRNNFASLSNGNTDGAPGGSFQTPGFYCDWNSYNIVLENNTVYDQTPKGIFLNGGTHGCRVEGNVVYGTNFLIDMNGASQPSVIHDDTIRYNSFFALAPLSVVMRQTSPNGTFDFGILDENHYFNPYGESRLTLRVNGGNEYRNLADWQSDTGNDLNTGGSFVNWTLPVNNSVLHTNPSDNTLSISLGTTKYLDLDGNEVCNSFSLQPWTSKILINSGEVCLALPVELLNFGARLHDTNSVLLEWLVGEELNHDFYEVEHCTDGLNFEPIGKVPGSQAEHYQFLHRQPADGVNYYRLRQVDLAGNSEFSPVAVVTMWQEGAVFYPNPVSEVLKVQTERPGLVRLFDACGKLLISERVEPGESEVDVSQMLAGVIFATFLSENGVSSMRLVIE